MDLSALRALDEGLVSLARQGAPVSDEGPHRVGRLMRTDGVTSVRGADVPEPILKMIERLT